MNKYLPAKNHINVLQTGLSNQNGGYSDSAISKQRGSHESSEQPDSSANTSPESLQQALKPFPVPHGGEEKQGGEAFLCLKEPCQFKRYTYFTLTHSPFHVLKLVKTALIEPRCYMDEIIAISCIIIQPHKTIRIAFSRCQISPTMFR